MPNLGEVGFRAGSVSLRLVTLFRNRTPNFSRTEPLYLCDFARFDRSVGYIAAKFPGTGVRPLSNSLKIYGQISLRWPERVWGAPWGGNRRYTRRTCRTRRSVASITSIDAQLDFSFGRTPRPIERRVAADVMLCLCSRAVISIVGI
jgi:hypothetical protein